MTRDLFIKGLVSDQVVFCPQGFVAEELSPEQFWSMEKVFFDQLLEISKADISKIDGFGELDADHKAPYASFKEYIVDTFDTEKENYWYHWTDMFESTRLSKEFFDQYYSKMMEFVPFCKEQRYLVNNNTFFCNMITDGSSMVGCSDWSRAGITDFLLDLVIMDMNKPYLLIPEHFNEYMKSIHVTIPHFKERFLCMAYFKGLDTLRWHASIDDEESCASIMKSIGELEERIMNL